MDITNKTQLDKDLQLLEDAQTTFGNAINAAIFTLNLCYDALWKLPEDRLLAVLQRLYDDGTLQPLFLNHYSTATGLNAAQDILGGGRSKAIAIAGRELTVSEDGVVSFAVIPIVEEISE